MKVMTILGTRPEIIRLSRVMARLDRTAGVEQVIVHTGQNYDYELNQVFFDDLEVREPDHFLRCDSSTLGHAYGDILVKSEDVLARESPDAVLILGDTNSAIAAVMARRMHIPVFHMEAGNRSFDWRVPEETNRRIVDHISDINLAYTEHARANLLREGIHPQRIYVSGSPMFEVLTHYRDQIDGSDVLEREGLRSKEYLIVSLHREENVDNPERLARVIETLDVVGRDRMLDVVVSTHPRTRKRLAEFGLLNSFSDRVRFAKPFGFHDYNKLQLESTCAISDSGTISEESAILGFPAVTPRDRIERPEAMDAGSIVVSGTEPDSVARATLLAIDLGPPSDLPPEYTVANCSERVVRLILGSVPTLETI